MNRVAVVEPSRKLPHNGIPRNPLGLQSQFTHRRRFIPYVVLESAQVRTTRQVPGVIRRFWRAAARYTGAPRPFSWTDNDFDGSAPNAGDGTTRLNFAFEDVGSAVFHYGNQLSRPMARPTLGPSVAAAAPRLITNGNVRNRPVLRVRIPSFGSRVPALNFAPQGTQE